jgi:hypothetical protein
MSPARARRPGRGRWGRFKNGPRGEEPFFTHTIAAISEYLSRAIRGGRHDDGLMQRFGLLVWPDQSREWRHVDRWPDKGARAISFEVFDRLDRLKWQDIGAQKDRGPDGDEEGLPFLRFDIAAYDRFVEWLSDLEKLLRGDLHPALESHLSKY